jgi:phosphoribosylanthranilate isomerase
MIVQIYTIQTPEEAVAVANLGVDHMGVTPANRGLPGEIDLPTTRAIFAAVGDRVKKVALSVEENLDDIVGLVEAVRPDILHLCGDIRAVPVQAVAALRKRIPGTLIMQAIPVRGWEAVDQALAFQEVAEYLILDSKSDQVTGIGATGAIHDWAVSRAIVEQSRLPVILAGGLSPANVAEAICQVRPWGVDSLTHTNLPLGGSKFRKDLERVRQFVSAARAV